MKKALLVFTKKLRKISDWSFFKIILSNITHAPPLKHTCGTYKKCKCTTFHNKYYLHPHNCLTHTHTHTL